MATASVQNKLNTEYRRRRQRLMAAIGPDGVAVVFATDLKSRNADVDYLFRPASDFVYLTGFYEPGSILVLAPGCALGEETLFVRPRNISEEQWNGRRLGVDRVSSTLGIQKSHVLDQLISVFPELIKDRKTLSTNLAGNSPLDAAVHAWMDTQFGDSIQGSFEELDDFSKTLHELRLFKSDAEISTMQRAADISVAAHQRVMNFCRPGRTELQLESELQHEFAMRGARHTAYPSIVASGDNACIMHYIENDATIQDGDLVLIDAGCELDCYASDITRTFPANGRFSGRQRDIYHIVLEAQLAAIESVRTGNAFTEPHDTSTRVLAQGLKDLGVLEGSMDQILEEELAKPFTVHRCSHFLGMDVHDVGARELDGQPRSLEPGMVLTVEPGLYFASSTAMPEYDEQWEGIGIRIEDDVLVTQQGHRVLTESLPKQAGEIEDLVNA